MSHIEQLDLFAYLEELEKESNVMELSLITPEIDAPLARRVPPLKRFGARLTRLWNQSLNLFGLVQWVNVYTVTRGFGGREAGCWYYLKYECVKSRQVGFWEADALRLKWLQQFKLSHKWGDVWSSNGGQDVVVCIEVRRAACHTVKQPSYEDYADQAMPYAIVHP